MSKARKILLYAIGAIAGLLVLAALAVRFFIDANDYKPRIESAAAEALGMQVSVSGNIGFSLFPGLRLTLDDVHIHNRGTELVAAQQARLEIALLPLLMQEVRIGKITLTHPSVYIERDSGGKFNFETAQAAGASLPVVDLPRITLADATFRYDDKLANTGIEAGDCSLDLRRLLLPGGKRSEMMNNLSFAAELACSALRVKDVTVSDIKLSIAAKNGSYDIKPAALSMFDGQGSGNLSADFSDAVPKYRVRYALTQFRIEDFFKILSQKQVLSGKMDLAVNLSLQGNTVNEVMQSANGDASLRGENLTLNGYDLDLEFSRYESSQNFNLVDVGALLIAGPAGLAVTKGYNFASILKDSGGSSDIRKIVSEWKVGDSVARAQDVAMATKENRLIFQGGLDFVHESFDDVSVTLIDDKGCAKVKQKIHGPFQKPEVENPNILKSLAGPALKLLKKGRKVFPGGECEAVYTGSVAPAQ